MSEQAIRIFITGACAGLAEARDALASHRDIELVGSSSDATKAGGKFASSGAQVIIQALQRPDSIPVDEIQRIREHTAAPIIMLVTHNTANLLNEAVALGINDVITLPQLADSLVFAVKKAHTMGSLSPASATGARRSESSRVITMFSPKGGVGKSMLAANMGALYAKQLKRRTLLIDLDLQFGDIALMLGADPRSTILDLVMSHGDLDSEKLHGFVTQHESGLHILPAPLRPEDSDLITEERLSSVLTAARQAYDIVIIDTAPKFDVIALTALDRTDELLLVASLEATSLKSVKVCLQTLAMLHYPIEKCHVVLNRADTRVGLKKDQVESALGKAIRFGIPSNKNVPNTINRGVPVVMNDAKSDVARSIREICVALCPDVMSDTNDAPTEIKLSRRERKRIEKEAARAAKREADIQATDPDSTTAPGEIPEFHNDYQEEAA